MADKAFYKQTTLPEIVPEEPLPPMPATIGPYKIESLLNSGGMSLLYLGVHLETKQPLAIKVLSPTYVNHPEAVEHFLKEAQIISLTNHPNIVKLYGEGKWEQGLYIAMELIQGISLRQFIMQQSLSLKRTLDILLQVSYALLHLHTHGVIHRDLKPENILITEEGEVKVIDFGIAQLHEERSEEKVRAQKSLMGTPHYMSPEQKEDPSKVSFASDIYALGIIAYELLLGKLSFGVINLVMLPKGLRKIITKALAVSINERYQDIVDFISDISLYLKSGELDKDRPGSDQIKEMHEGLQRAITSLSPISLPEWTIVEMGVAKYKGAGQSGVYYDFFKFSNNSYLLLIAETLTSGFEAPIYIGVLRGMVRYSLYNIEPSFKDPFQLSPFLTKLNRQLCEDYIGQRYAMSCLLLDPLRDQLSFAACGLGPLLQIPQGNLTPRTLGSSNLSLGVDPQAEFAATTDNWNLSDTLILHSFELSPPPDELAAQLTEAISDNLYLSPNRQAEAILKKTALVPSFILQRQPKILFSLQRIG